MTLGLILFRSCMWNIIRVVWKYTFGQDIKLCGWKVELIKMSVLVFVKVFRSVFCDQTRSHLKTSTFTWTVVCLVERLNGTSTVWRGVIIHRQNLLGLVYRQWIMHQLHPLTAALVISLVTQLGARHSYKPISMSSQSGSIIHSQWAISTKCLLMTSSAETLMIRLPALGDICFCEDKLIVL